MTRAIAVALLGALWAVPAHALRTEGPQGTGLEDLERAFPPQTTSSPTTGLEEVRYQPTTPKYQLVVVGPGTPGIAPLLFQAQAATGKVRRFVMLVNTTADRKRMIQWLEQENAVNHVPPDIEWRSWVIPINKAPDESYDAAYGRAILGILSSLQPTYDQGALMLLVQAASEPKLVISGVKPLRVPLFGEKDLQKMLATLFDDYGARVRLNDIRDVIKRRFRELQNTYLTLEQQL